MLCPFQLKSGASTVLRSIQRWVSCSLFFLIATYASSQLPDYHLRIFDYTYGIRPGTIVDLAKDRQGFLWVLYPRSVQRFDGRDIRTFRPAGNLEDVFCDNQGGIWVSTSDRVFRYDHIRQEFLQVDIQGDPKQRTTGQVFQMPDQSIWLVTSIGFFRYEKEKLAFVSGITDLHDAPRYNVKSFGSAGNTLFFAHNGYVYRFHTLSHRLDSLPDRNLRRIFPISEDTVVVNTWALESYWYDFDKGSVSLTMLPEQMRDSSKGPLIVRSIAKVSPTAYVFAARDGIFTFDRQQKSFRELHLFHNGRPIITKDFTNNVICDEEGDVWMAAVEGIARFTLSGQAFGLMRIRGDDERIPVGIDNIRSITEDDDGNLWLATGNGFVRWILRQNSQKIYLQEEGRTDRLAYPSIRGIAFDGKYVILGPADLGVWLFDPVKETYRRPRYRTEEVGRVSQHDFFDGITTLNNGDHMFLGRDAIYILDGSTYELSFLDIPPARENSNYAFQSPRGEIWLTTMRGMHLVDADLNYVQRVELPDNVPFVWSGTILPDQRLLFSIEAGLFTAAYVNGKVTVSKYTDLFDGVVMATLFYDQNDILWATSENGIYRFDPATSKVNLYDYSDNVQGYGFNGNSYHITSDGILFFGGINGLNYLSPEKFSVPEDTLRVYIQSVKSGERDSVYYSLKEEAVLSYTNRSVEIEFVCPYFNNPDKVQYRYRLEGLDEEWKYIGNTQQLRFPSLPPGRYRFILEASINKADWIRADDVFGFRIKSPFWLSWWFIALCLLLISSGLWAFIRSRNRRIEEKQEELEAEQAINYFSSRMVGSQTVEELLRDVAKNCIGRLQFEHCGIYILDESRNVLLQVAAHGPGSPQKTQTAVIEIPVGKGICGAVAETGKPVIIHDTALDPQSTIGDVPRASEIVVPILSDSRVFGVINCAHSRKRFFTQRHLSILTTIASLCAARMVKARAEAEKSEAERVLMETKQQMADVEMQALRAQMNPHFIFNCLNSINRYIVKSDQATASLYLTRFAKLIRLILDNSNSSTVTLTNELEALRLYIEMESIRFEKQFTYKIIVDEDVMPDHVYVPPLIIQPYVENAIWHGLLHKESAGHLSVHIILKSSTLLECLIEDNGVGRERARELKSKSASASKSLGMKLTESRLALLNQHTQWETAVEITDLKDAEGNATGTRVTLRIPVDAK